MDQGIREELEAGLKEHHAALARLQAEKKACRSMFSTWVRRASTSLIASELRQVFKGHYLDIRWPSDDSNELLKVTIACTYEPMKGDESVVRQVQTSFSWSQDAHKMVTVEIMGTVFEYWVNEFVSLRFEVRVMNCLLSALGDLREKAESCVPRYY
ncbi:hypothetical protein [Dyella tabacisoli]|uniref:Uncharacterized protein n=1 Tax=Dyella tabacisoli TaxID=2282381 RepID=A0A369UM97_9GAMM|nr:hypothetical protein [Dyella tabacisoli]RDD80828.1 hypothetical protein DVJ77_15345 [Dyella tabacisoli]